MSGVSADGAAWRRHVFDRTFLVLSERDTLLRTIVRRTTLYTNNVDRPVYTADGPARRCVSVDGAMWRRREARLVSD